MVRSIAKSAGRTVAITLFVFAALLVTYGVKNALGEATCGSPSLTQYNGSGGPQFHDSRLGVNVGFSNPDPSESQYFWYSGHVTYYDQYGNDVWDANVDSFTNSNAVAWGSQAPSNVSWTSFVANGQEAPSDQYGNRFQGQTVIGNASGGC